MGHKGEKCQFNTNEYADFIKVKITKTAAFTFYSVEHYLLCYFFALKIVAHIAFAIQRAVMILFNNNNSNKKSSIRFVCYVRLKETEVYKWKEGTMTRCISDIVSS